MKIRQKVIINNKILIKLNKVKNIKKIIKILAKIIK